MKKNIHQSADFLNKPFFHSDATIYTCLTINEESIHGGWDASLKIRDCSESVSIYVDADSIEELENSIYKLNTLINSLTKFRSVIIKHGYKFAKMREKRRSEEDNT